MEPATETTPAADPDRGPAADHATRCAAGPVGTCHIWLECSATRQRDMNTGIQRVVRNIVNAADGMNQRGEARVAGLWFDRQRGLQAIQRLPLPASQLPWQSHEVHGWQRWAREGLSRLGLLQLTRWVRKSASRGQTQLRAMLRGLFPQGVLPGRGDVVLLLDSTSQIQSALRDLQRARQRGARLGVVVYDLIPHEHPEFVEHAFHLDSVRDWRVLRTMADFLICISRSVREDVIRFEERLVQQGWPRRERPIGWFTLGAELDAVSDQGACRPQLDEVLPPGGAREALLMVGSISPRKNHHLALEALEHCWRRGSPQRLVIAGGIGWNCDDLVSRLRGHPELGRRLFWFADLRDHELDLCYRRCRALLTPSLAEGFNLPIVEALSRGATVLASDLPVHREVGGRFAAYFPPDDATALASLIDQLATTALLPGVAPPEEFHWPGWDASCRELLAETERLAGACP
jgi:glycosyltransferase involved in cell wall biosynthesis